MSSVIHNATSGLGVRAHHVPPAAPGAFCIPMDAPETVQYACDDESQGSFRDVMSIRSNARPVIENIVQRRRLRYVLAP